MKKTIKRRAFTIGDKMKMAEKIIKGEISYAQAKDHEGHDIDRANVDRWIDMYKTGRFDGLDKTRCRIPAEEHLSPEELKNVDKTPIKEFGRRKEDKPTNVWAADSLSDFIRRAPQSVRDEMLDMLIEKEELRKQNYSLKERFTKALPKNLFSKNT